MLSSCSGENKEEVGKYKADNDNAYSNAVVALSEYVSYTANVNIKDKHIKHYGQLEKTLSNNTRHVAIFASSGHTRYAKYA